MDFFDKLSDTLVTATKEVGQKAKGMTDIAKLQYEMKSREDDLRKKFEALGKKYYQQMKSDVPEEDAADFEEIEIMMNRINDLNEEILEMKGAKSCPKCGAKVAENATYCSSCGAKLNDMFEED